jgi:sugar phosphate isomerase/epimerase
MNDDAVKTSYEILAYISLEKDRALNGNPLILVAKNVEEQKQMCLDIARALKAEVVQLHCGDYMIIG